MQALLTLGKNVKELNSNINIGALINEIIKNEGLDDYILDLNSIDQLFDKGINKDNVVVGFYSKATESINPKKKAGSHFTFKDTGDFFRSFGLTYESDGIVINADGQKKNDNLFVKYGDNILGLTDENLQKLINEIKKHLPTYILAEILRNT